MVVEAATYALISIAGDIFIEVSAIHKVQSRLKYVI